MKHKTLDYDDEGDILHIRLSDSEDIGLGLHLNRNFVLHVSPETGAPLRLMIHNASKVMCRSLNGSIGYPLDDAAIPLRFRSSVMRSLKHTPLSQYVSIRRSSTSKKVGLVLGEYLLPRAMMVAATS